MSKRIFYIDIENVGMKEIHNAKTFLKETDKIVVFINDNQPNLYKDVCFELAQTTAATEIQTFKSRTKNALDFHICASIGLMGSSQNSDIYIVSHDKGYSGAMELFQKNGIHITRVSSLNELQDESAQYEQMKAKVSLALKNVSALKGTSKQIKLCMKLMKESKEKWIFHNSLQKTFTSMPDVKPLYKSLLPIYKEYILNKTTQHA